ncbi:MFS transporter [Caldovatus sediminis]|uniref:MFS transporter n=1 Tax=Caldovatus sediminis TaxID=2041189 RepID=A0A8J3EDB7_9PROT|nr:MFS transporter [Caldovatus sediminis]GGG42871.1 MFS transporter [Caldovatus sediminis]
MQSAAASRFAALYAAQFGAVGVMLPFLPLVLAEAGLAAAEVAAVLAAGAAVRLVAGPLGGRAADALGDARLMLAAGAAAAAVTACGFGLAAGFAALLAVNVLHSAAMAPVIPLTDALALGAARREAAGRRGFDYGRVRAAGSASFILAATLAGWVAERLGLVSVVWLFAAALAASALLGARLPAPAGGGARDRARGGAGFRAPLRLPAFRLLLLLSALIQGSHALYYGFGSIHWAAAGHSATVIGLLWAEGVVAEVALFLWGRRLADRLGPVGLSLLAAGAGALRWAVTAETTALPALAAVQLLHAATFGAQHLAAMGVLMRVVPPPMAATAQTLHASLGVGLASGALTLASGPLYAALGGAAFWAMAGLCAAAVPVAWRLRVVLANGQAGRTPVA